MDHIEWGNKYLEQAEILKDRISSLKSSLNTCKVIECKDIQNRINIMYEMYLDCVYTGSYLKERQSFRKWL